MDWVHCNNCFILPDREKTFLLTSCGHIYCSDCEEQCAQGQCKLCGNQCSTISLSSTMKPDVQIYFTDPDELLKKKLQEVQKVSEFQKNHRARLMTYQRKQLQKFKAVKEDFRKLLKNLKELDSERKRLSQENDAMKQFIGRQRNTSNSNPGSAQRSEKGHKSPKYDISPSSNLNSVLSKFADKREHSNQIAMPQRMCVITPPQNGKMGVIQSTPSPSTNFKKLNISSHSNDSSYMKGTSQFISPSSTPGNICDKYGSFLTPQSLGVSSSIGSYASPIDHPLKNAPYKRDVRKLVVHPYSPND